MGSHAAKVRPRAGSDRLVRVVRQDLRAGREVEKPVPVAVIARPHSPPLVMGAREQSKSRQGWPTMGSGPEGRPPRDRAPIRHPSDWRPGSRPARLGTAWPSRGRTPRTRCDGAGPCSPPRARRRRAVPERAARVARTLDRCAAPTSSPTPSRQLATGRPEDPPVVPAWTRSRTGWDGPDLSLSSLSSVTSRRSCSTTPDRRSTCSTSNQLPSPAAPAPVPMPGRPSSPTAPGSPASPTATEHPDLRSGPHSRDYDARANVRSHQD